MDLKDIQIQSEGEVLLLIRRRCNLTQFQFAEKLGVSKNHINLIENGKYPLSKKTKKKVKDFLNGDYLFLADHKEV